MTPYQSPLLFVWDSVWPTQVSGVWQDSLGQMVDRSMEEQSRRVDGFRNELIWRVVWTLLSKI